jgi:hypothetical protein
LRKKVGNGATTQFWRDVSKRCVPRLFSVSAYKDLLRVSDAGVWVAGRWIWSLEWRRYLFDWERDLYHNLLEVICGASLSAAEDKWILVEDGDGMIRDCYGPI